MGTHFVPFVPRSHFPAITADGTVTPAEFRGAVTR